MDPNSTGEIRENIELVSPQNSQHLEQNTYNGGPKDTEDSNIQHEIAKGKSLNSNEVGIIDNFEGEYYVEAPLRVQISSNDDDGFHKENTPKEGSERTEKSFQEKADLKDELEEATDELYKQDPPTDECKNPNTSISPKNILLNTEERLTHGHPGKIPQLPFEEEDYETGYISPQTPNVCSAIQIADIQTGDIGEDDEWLSRGTSLVTSEGCIEMQNEKLLDEETIGSFTDHTSSHDDKMVREELNASMYQNKNAKTESDEKIQIDATEEAKRDKEFSGSKHNDQPIIEPRERTVLTESITEHHEGQEFELTNEVNDAKEKMVTTEYKLNNNTGITFSKEVSPQHEQILSEKVVGNLLSDDQKNDTTSDINHVKEENIVTETSDMDIKAPDEEMIGKEEDIDCPEISTSQLDKLIQKTSQPNENIDFGPSEKYGIPFQSLSTALLSEIPVEERFRTNGLVNAHPAGNSDQISEDHILETLDANKNIEKNVSLDEGNCVSKNPSIKEDKLEGLRDGKNEKKPEGTSYLDPQENNSQTTENRSTSEEPQSTEDQGYNVNMLIIPAVVAETKLEENDYLRNLSSSLVKEQRIRDGGKYIERQVEIMTETAAESKDKKDEFEESPHAEQMINETPNSSTEHKEAAEERESSYQAYVEGLTVLNLEDKTSSDKVENVNIIITEQIQSTRENVAEEAANKSLGEERVTETVNGRETEAMEIYKYQCNSVSVEGTSAGKTIHEEETVHSKNEMADDIPQKEKTDIKSTDCSLTSQLADDLAHERNKSIKLEEVGDVINKKEQCSEKVEDQIEVEKQSGKCEMPNISDGQIDEGIKQNEDENEIANNTIERVSEDRHVEMKFDTEPFSDTIDNNDDNGLSVIDDPQQDKSPQVPDMKIQEYANEKINGEDPGKSKDEREHSEHVSPNTAVPTKSEEKGGNENTQQENLSREELITNMEHSLSYEKELEIGELAGTTSQYQDGVLVDKIREEKKIEKVPNDEQIHQIIVEENKTASDVIKEEHNTEEVKESLSVLKQETQEENIESGVVKDITEISSVSQDYVQETISETTYSTECDENTHEAIEVSKSMGSTILEEANLTDGEASMSRIRYQAITNEILDKCGLESEKLLSLQAQKIPHTPVEEELVISQGIISDRETKEPEVTIGDDYIQKQILDKEVAVRSIDKEVNESNCDSQENFEATSEIETTKVDDEINCFPSHEDLPEMEDSLMENIKDDISGVVYEEHFGEIEDRDIDKLDNITPNLSGETCESFKPPKDHEEGPLEDKLLDGGKELPSNMVSEEFSVVAAVESPREPIVDKEASINEDKEKGALVNRNREEKIEKVPNDEHIHNIILEENKTAFDVIKEEYKAEEVKESLPVPKQETQEKNIGNDVVKDITEILSVSQDSVEKTISQTAYSAEHDEKTLEAIEVSESMGSTILEEPNITDGEAYITGIHYQVITDDLLDKYGLESEKKVSLQEQMIPDSSVEEESLNSQGISSDMVQKEPEVDIGDDYIQKHIIDKEVAVISIDKEVQESNCDSQENIEATSEIEATKVDDEINCFPSHEDLPEREDSLMENTEDDISGVVYEKKFGEMDRDMDTVDNVTVNLSGETWESFKPPKNHEEGSLEDNILDGGKALPSNMVSGETSAVSAVESPQEQIVDKEASISEDEVKDSICLS